MYLPERVEQKLREWNETKCEMEKERRKSKLVEKRTTEEEKQKKKELSQQSYQQWLDKNKNKSANRTTYGYANG